jgi:hypothetical protein
MSTFALSSCLKNDEGPSNGKFQIVTSLLMMIFHILNFQVTYFSL